MPKVPICWVLMADEAGGRLFITNLMNIVAGFRFSLGGRCMKIGWYAGSKTASPGVFGILIFYTLIWCGADLEFSQ